MWLFAVLVVLLMGAVAVVASGRGAPLAEAYDDRVDATVPAHGPISAADLRRVRFPLAFRGYRMEEVDALLDRLASEREEADRLAAEQRQADAERTPEPEPELEPEREPESAQEWAPWPTRGDPPPP